VTAHPTAEWTGQKLREAFLFDQLSRYLLRDRDAIFGDSPEPRSIQPEHAGRVVALFQVGGLHHRYERRAA
jgi:hypothetical protein